MKLPDPELQQPVCQMRLDRAGQPCNQHRCVPGSAQATECQNPSSQFRCLMNPSEVNPTRRRSFSKLALAGLVSPWLGGCATTYFDRTPLVSNALEEPSFLAPPKGTQRACALVLSGGGARGFAHLGVLRVLEREGLRPDLVVGSSAGAIVGALWASGMTATEIERASDQLDWSVLFDFDPIRAVFGGLGLGLVRGDRLEKFLRQFISKPIENFPIPFAAVATDMENAESVALNRGDAAKAVRASCAVPALYEPVRARGRLLADGQISSPLPVPTARLLGAIKVLAVDTIFPPHHAEMSNPLSMLFQSLIVSGWRHLLTERAQANLIIAPEIRTSAQLGFDSRDWVIKAGEAAAVAQLPEIKRLFASSVSPSAPFNSI